MKKVKILIIYFIYLIMILGIRAAHYAIYNFVIFKSFNIHISIRISFLISFLIITIYIV